MSLKNRHVYGAGAAACAVCYATPVLTFLGVGAAATVATLLFAVVVAAAAAFAVWRQRRRVPRAAWAPVGGRSTSSSPPPGRGRTHEWAARPADVAPA